MRATQKQLNYIAYLARKHPKAYAKGVSKVKLGSYLTKSQAWLIIATAVSKVKKASPPQRGSHKRKKARPNRRASSGQ